MGRFDTLRDVFKNTKHKKPSHIFCPKCGSPDIALASSLNYWLTPQNYLCKKCGYNGPVYMELEEDSEQKLDEKDTSVEKQEQKGKEEADV